MGSRHRAALTLSKETDAAVLVVSEETGRISLALRGSLRTDLDGVSLRDALINLSSKKK
jgi:diadenylate cyclase